MSVTASLKIVHHTVYWILLMTLFINGTLILSELVLHGVREFAGQVVAGIVSCAFDCAHVVCEGTFIQVKRRSGVRVYIVFVCPNES